MLQKPSEAKEETPTPEITVSLADTLPRTIRVMRPIGDRAPVAEGDAVVLLGRLTRPFTVRTTRTPLSFISSQLQIGRNEKISISFSSQGGAARYICDELNATYSGGGMVLVSGKIKYFGSDGISLAANDIMRAQGNVGELTRKGYLLTMPVYPLTKGVTQNQVRAAIRSASQNNVPVTQVPKKLEAVFQAQGLVDYRQALGIVHGLIPVPASWASSLAQGDSPAHRRLAAEAIWKLAKKDSSLFSRRTAKARIAMRADKQIAVPPFDLTGDQQTAIREVARDITGEKAMYRLLQGDVGSGKSIVAYLSAFGVYRAGHQAVLMAPTEILARQLYDGMNEVLEWAKMQGKAYFLTGNTKVAMRREIEAKAEKGERLIVVGTHAVAGVDYQKLGLLVIDEEQRFGMDVKNRLLDRGPHCLLMSATPIPRSLANATFGNSSVSVIAEKPPGRQAIQTLLVDRSDEKRKMVQAMKRAFADGRQAFVVCPSIDGQEMQGVEKVAEGLRKLFGDEQVAVAHGNLPADQMQQALSDFNAGDVSCLVATTVIEVGINVPNATIMVVADPHRLGMSQLHQIRGRVGRGVHAGTCYLAPQDEISTEAKERLLYFASTDDGFRIAEYDMDVRGSGDLRTRAQSGTKGINLVEHGDIVGWVREYIEDREAKTLQKQVAYDDNSMMEFAI